MHILSVYIFQVGVSQRLYGRTCWYRTQVCMLVPLWNSTKLSSTV